MTSIPAFAPVRDLTSRSQLRVAHRRAFAALLPAVLATEAVVLVVTGALLPWVTVLHGFQPIAGTNLGGGDLAGLAVLGAAALLAAHRHGVRAGRPVAMAAGVVVVVGALLAARNLAAYVADPGPAAALVAPIAGPGPWVLAAGGVLLVAASVRRAPARPATSALGLRLGLAGLTFVAGWFHLLLTPQHLGEATLLGTGFLLSGLAQLALALLALERPTQTAMLGLVTLNVALIAIWAYAVLVGLPFGGGHEHAAETGWVIGHGEPVDLAGVVTKVAELASTAAALVLYRRLAVPAQERNEG